MHCDAHICLDFQCTSESPILMYFRVTSRYGIVWPMLAHGIGQLWTGIIDYRQHFNFLLQADANKELSAACNSKQLCMLKHCNTICLRSTKYNDCILPQGSVNTSWWFTAIVANLFFSLVANVTGKITGKNFFFIQKWSVWGNTFSWWLICNLLYIYDTKTTGKQFPHKSNIFLFQ